MAFNVTEGGMGDYWIMDSSATSLMCKDNKSFVEYKETMMERNVLSAKNRKG